MAKKDYVKKTGGIIGGIVGCVIGIGAGGVHAAAKLIQTGDLRKAEDAFDSTSDAVIEGSVEVGEDLAPGIILTIGGIITKKAKAIKSQKKDNNST